MKLTIDRFERRHATFSAKQLLSLAHDHLVEQGYIPKDYTGGIDFEVDGGALAGHELVTVSWDYRDITEEEHSFR